MESGKVGRLYLHSKQDSDQKVASLNPTWENQGWREREDEKRGREDEMKGTDGEEAGGRR